MSKSISKNYNFKDLTGKKFNKLTTIRFSHFDASYKAYWIFNCDCGAKKVVLQGYLVSKGITKSCGCLHKEVMTRHGQSGRGKETPEYISWISAKQRCTNPNKTGYADYGGRGITFCDRWCGNKGFINFFEDMGPKPSEKHSLDRIDVDGNYEPSNCKWSTPIEQAQNTRSFPKSENHIEHIYNRKYLSKYLVNCLNINFDSQLFKERFGCTLPEFIKHIESQFKYGMSWENYGKYTRKNPNVWEFDHIIGCNQFDLSKEEDCLKCFHYSNLRPWWGKDNVTRHRILVTA